MAGRKNPFLVDEDNPELTDAQLAEMRPAANALPSALYAELTKRKPGQRGPGKREPKVAVTLRLDRAALEAFKAQGPGWQSRINDVVVTAARSKAVASADRSKKRA